MHHFALSWKVETVLFFLHQKVEIVHPLSQKVEILHHFPLSQKLEMVPHFPLSQKVEIMPSFLLTLEDMLIVTKTSNSIFQNILKTDYYNISASANTVIDLGQVRENFLKIQIYFEELNYDTITESAAYSVCSPFVYCVFTNQ